MVTDDSVMQGGKYSGFKMKDIPAEYLIYVYEEKKCHWDVKRWIEANYNELKAKTTK